MKDKKSLFLNCFIVITIVLIVIILLYSLVFKKSTSTETKSVSNSNETYVEEEGQDEKVTLSLKGDTTVKIKLSEEYVDPGFSATSDINGDISSYVNVTNNVDVTTAGTYEVTYAINYKTFVHTLKRKVIVYEEKISTPTTIYLKLNGTTNCHVPVSIEYKDPGVTITDKDGNDITNDCNITTEGSVDSSKAGTYSINYNISYKNINKTLTRNVIVYEVLYDVNVSESGLTNKTLNVEFNTESEYFDHVTYEDKSTNVTNFNFNVEKNTVITFTVYDKFGYYNSKTLTVNNIDKSAPSGTCSGYYKDGKTYLTLTSKDNIGFSHYLINKEKYTGNNVTLNKEYSSLNVTLYDNAGNKTDISCKLENKNTYSAVYDYKSNSDYHYWINVPEGTPQGSPLLIFLHGDGEVGSKDGVKNLYQFKKAIEYSSKNEKFITIAPVTTVYDWSATSIQKKVKNLIDEVVSTYKVDKKRIYIIGFSRGAIGTWGMISNYPNYFAAAIPISCCAPSYFDASKAAKTPVLAYSGTVGTESSYGSCMSSLVDKINKNGGKATKKTINGASHSTMSSSLNYNEIYSWMLKNKRS